MRKKITLLFSVCFSLVSNFCFAQSYFQNFDGADTSKYNSLIIHFDTANHPNIWQVGRPHKHYFDSAYSRPNVLVTDTSIPYPIKNTSIFSFEVPIYLPSIYVLQWVQKLDMDSGKDGGIVEYSIDTGKTWYNAFHSPYVMSFYGFNAANKMVLPSGDTAFSGTDSTWKDIWLCFNTYTMPYSDSLYLRYRFVSDSINNNREGWMIDNMSAHLTILHPVKEVKGESYLKVYPRLTNGPIYIKAKSKAAGFSIQHAELVNELGEVASQYDIGPGDSEIDISSLPGGWYILKVTTSTITESYKVWLKKD